MEIPAKFIYKSEKKELIDQMKEKILKMKKYDERNMNQRNITREEKKGRKKVWKKRKIKVKNNKKFLCIFFLQFSTF